jgi:non-canonical purine NTP pyrophosphatase (RdgB/HAM1 family)
MKELVFVTTNAGKVATLQKYIDHARIDIKVSMRALDIAEIQADTSIEIARDKALRAFEIINEPLVVDDSEFRIKALNGFPGPYQKYVVKTLGPEGVVRLMEGREDRSAYFISNLVYVARDGSVHEFSDDPGNVRIVERYDPTVPEYEWGALGKICIHEGTDRVWSLLTADERHANNLARPGDDAYEKFVAWYGEHDK